MHLSRSTGKYFNTNAIQSLKMIRNLLHNLVYSAWHNYGKNNNNKNK